MKITKILYKTVLMVLLIVICSSCMCYATTGSVNTGNFKPPVTALGGTARGIVNKILGVLIIIGISATVIGIALIGFNTMMGSASEKAANQEKYVGIVIAAILITGVSSIAKMIIGFAEKII